MKIKSDKTRMTAAIFIVLLMAFVMLVAIQVQPLKGLPQPSSEQPYIGPLHPGDVPNCTEYDGTTRAALSFRPTTIGVNQELLVNMWITPSGASSNIKIPDGGFVITINKPDGTQDTISLPSEPASFANWFPYIPDQVGQYSLKFDFLGAYFPAANAPMGYYDGLIYPYSTPDMTLRHYTRNNFSTVPGVEPFPVSTYFKPSSTGWQNLTVQPDFVWSWPPAALPTDYWTRPASLNNREWWPILGSWPGTGYNGYGYANWDTLYPGNSKTYGPDRDFTPWVQAPNSAHVVWKKLGAIAGLIGGPAGQYGTTSAPSTPDVIYAGRCYDTETVTINGIPTRCATCYDLRTGEYYYQIPTSQGGRTPSYVAYYPPQHTSEFFSQTWSVDLIAISGSTLYKIDPLTGAVSSYSISPLSGGTFMNQNNGYVVNVQNLGGENRLINWTTRGGASNIADRIVSNTSYALDSLPRLLDWENDLGGWVADYYPYDLGPGGGPFNSTWPSWLINWKSYRLSTGEELYDVSTDAFPDNPFYDFFVMDHGKIAVWTFGGNFDIFDAATGEWFRTEGTDYPWSSIGGFGAYAVSSGYGLLIRYAYNGIYAFNWTDGKLVWHYEAPVPANFESPYITEDGKETYPFMSDGVIADGKLYTCNNEHTPTQPITRGWSLYCINITTGEEIWKLMNQFSSYSSNYAISDGYMVAGNLWDGYMYVIGKGKSATTVTTNPGVIAKGGAVLIQGTVLDESPAQPGTPCVSKESMSQQMEYLHMQQPIGGLWNNVTITGVPVALSAIGPDGTPYDLGTTISNGYSGAFNLAWTPPAQGIYEIMASFAGDDSYGSSMSTTAVLVGPAPSPGEPQETEEPTTETPTTEAPTTEAPTSEAPTTEAPTSEVPTTEQPSAEAPAFPTTEVIIIAAVAVAAIIGIGAYWILRRQK